MARGRPPLPVGTYGRVSFLPRGEQVRARTRFRDYDGRVRYVAAHGASRAAAERALKAALLQRTTVAGGGDLTRDTTMADLATEYLRSIADASLARSTKARYAEVLEDFITPGLGGLRLYELSLPAVDRFLRSVATNHGSATAKVAKSVLSGMCAVAMRHGALTVNPTLGVTPIPTTSRRVPRALSVDDERALVEKVAANEEARRLDVADLVVFMLGTGVRIGEALAVSVDQLDLTVGTLEVNATMTRFGREPRPKTKAGWRVIALPHHVVGLLRRRIADDTLRTDVALFPSPIGRQRDVSNTSGDLRRLLDSLGFEWVSSHTFRKTVATRLDDAGLSARQIADHLGHAKPSMTQDVYMGRQVTSSRAAEVLARD